ncbi:double-strand break repair protein AddB [Poseidonocella sp. HB161398]|uniref:double-strand break repair protein AddB n=1 Tax=Poseidonocella sp. HB161398 TaxID=2320855 RepID=UPI001108F0C4|nr:double-strand break repair protein AddB [Poseidonocella sp. HB161398]
MLEPTDRPRVFSLAPGQDFPAALAAGLRQRLEGQPPEAIARVTVYVNTQRMKRRIEELFHATGPGFLPRLKLVTEAGAGLMTHGAPPQSQLARQLQLTRLTAALIAAQPDLAPPSAAFDLAGGLANLMDEAQVEGVPIEDILNLDIADASGHWQRAMAFLRIVLELGLSDPLADPAARARAEVEALIRLWQAAPPADPVFVAGSTGSRGTTHLLMQAVARLPQGGLILPGFDHDMPHGIWTTLTAPERQEDHPQYRFALLLRDLGLAPEDVTPWLAGQDAPDPARNRLISMALRPAPVTDGWMRDGPSLGDLGAATRNLTLLEAADPRAEAEAIAVVLRKAAEDGVQAALISPDRVLTRRVAAALDRWAIEPDDSAGEPLGQTATGRLIRTVAGLMGQRLTAEDLVVILKNPHVGIGSRRGPHLRLTRELELRLRRKGPAFPDRGSLTEWAASRDDPEATAWAAWVADCLDGLEPVGTRTLEAHLADLRARVELLARGAFADSGVPLWDGRDGEAAEKAMNALAQDAGHGGELDVVTFNSVLRGSMSEEVRDPALPHPGVMIWGTLEARVQGAELVILAGLNDGVWPEQPEPDPWLNRQMRKAAGLLLPERRIGLAAHDFQQAAGAPQVVLARAVRSAEADAVPSRWLNRLTNLLDGLPEQGGPEALADMRRRGRHWCDLAAALDVPAVSEPPAPRPSPAPPRAARPRKLSVTEVETLLRDPYQIYARHVLRLRALDPLRHRPEASLRGTVLHQVLEEVVPHFPGLDRARQKALLLGTGAEVLERIVPWPTARRFWLARLMRIADHFIAEEEIRRGRGTLMATEQGGGHVLPTTGVELVVKTDRIDQAPGGAVWLYDYKTGKPPTEKQQARYNKQLHITAYLAEAGAFGALGPLHVVGAEYIGLAARPETVPADLEKIPVELVPESLHRLFTRFLDPATGFTAQVARESQGEWSDYDHLSRGGEWDLTQHAETLKVGDHE